MGEFEPGAMSS